MTDYSRFSIPSDGYTVTRRVTSWARTARGSWERVAAETETLTPYQYINFIRTVPVFRSMWRGVSACRVTRGHTPAGLVPVRVAVLSPGGSSRVVNTFEIHYTHPN